MRCRNSMIPWWVFTQNLPKSCDLSANEFPLFRRIEKVCWTLFRLLRSFCLALVRLNPLSGKIHHDCVSMTISNFTSFIEDFEIDVLNFQYTFRKEPSNLGSLADFAIFFFGGGDSKIFCFRDATFERTFHIWISRNFCRCKDFCDLDVLCEFTSDDSGTHSLQFPVIPSLLRVFTGSTEKGWSCGAEIEDETVVELDDSLGTTNGTKF